MSKKVILIIMDGWGHGPDPKRSAIAQANTPFVDSLYKNYPNTELITHSESVGLPDGQMGNSEVGHLNIGAGRVVYQELARINKAVRERELNQNPTLLKAIQGLDKGWGQRQGRPHWAFAACSVQPAGRCHHRSFPAARRAALRRSY